MQIQISQVDIEREHLYGLILIGIHSNLYAFQTSVIFARTGKHMTIWHSSDLEMSSGRTARNNYTASRLHCRKNWSTTYTGYYESRWQRHSPRYIYKYTWGGWEWEVKFGGWPKTQVSTILELKFWPNLSFLRGPMGYLVEDPWSS